MAPKVRVNSSWMVFGFIGVTGALATAVAPVPAPPVMVMVGAEV